MGWIIVFGFSMLMTVGSIVAAVQEKMVEMFLVLAIFVILDIISWKKYQNTKNGITKKKKQEKQTKKQENQAKKQEQKETAAKTIFSAMHQAGLPIAQAAMCRISSESDCYKISGGGTVFELKKDKITDIAVKTDVEIQKQYVSSIGGAVAGGMVFGALGTIVGGRAKEKKSTTVTYYLIYTYYSDDKINYVSFEVNDAHDLKMAIKWEKEFHNKTIVPNKVEL